MEVDEPIALTKASREAARRAHSYASDSSSGEESDGYEDEDEEEDSDTHAASRLFFYLVPSFS